jgi:hypothetical protein
MLRPADYAHPVHLPHDLPAHIMVRLAASPRTAHLVSATMLAASSLEIRPSGPDVHTIRLALLDRDVLDRLACMIGVAWLAPQINEVIDGPTLEYLGRELGEELLGFAQNTAPLLRSHERIEFDPAAPELAAAAAGAGYRTLLEALQDEPPWLVHRFRLKCPQPLDERVDLREVPRESQFALTIRVARQLPAPWSTLFAHKAA